MCVIYAIIFEMCNGTCLCKKCCDVIKMNFIYVAIVYLVLDMIWIQVMTPMLYKSIFQGIQKTELKFSIKYALAAYIVLLGVLYFVCRPLSRSTFYVKTPWLAYGLVGFALYSVYNLTNAAVFTSYPLHMILIDTIWGTTVFSILGILDGY